MLFKMENSLRDYIDGGHANLTETMSTPSPWLSAIEDCYAFFKDGLLTGEQDVTPTGAVLLMNSFMLYVSAIRMALTGHAAATYPLLRTALESVCYGHLMACDAEVERIWLDRHKDEASTKAARNRFTSAVTDVAKAIARAESQPAKADVIIAAYQGSIDYGAHPNPKAVYSHMQPPKDIGTHVQVDLTGLHHAGSLEYDRSLLACFHFAILIATIMAHALTTVSDETLQKLHGLNDMKEALLESEFPEAYAAMGPLPR
ncbi:hypothetical protein L907_17560 [Agrobacterium sp. C13]|nr:hypothetical protein L902_01650 [Agrobacterium radiobacter DSM 30147]KVK49857.1 hypothetical protein L903_18460 [Agrobacterium sp. JL28]KVK50149.1 hypothetical protein L904_18460 [Agrobacterium sp. LY4]KVK62907.1 hypothetical protein L906_17600 [Agrobacterium sp. TS45]KVK67429.1 hypothetical protein L907_17560 [Agrobacterium sp. C13]